MFTRHEGDPKIPMVEMQVSWYSLAAARCHLSAKRLGMALKYFRQVESYFDQYREDQVDFHSYCLRKLTLGAYLDMIQMEDNLLADENYRNAAYEIASILLHFSQTFEKELEEKQNTVGYVREEDIVNPKLNSKERKKLKNKWRLQEKKEQDKRKAFRRAMADELGWSICQGKIAKDMDQEKSEKANQQDFDPLGEEYVEELRSMYNKVRRLFISCRYICLNTLADIYV